MVCRNDEVRIKKCTAEYNIEARKKDKDIFGYIS